MVALGGSVADLHPNWFLSLLLMQGIQLLFRLRFHKEIYKITEFHCQWLRETLLLVAAGIVHAAPQMMSTNNEHADEKEDAGLAALTSGWEKFQVSEKRKQLQVHRMQVKTLADTN